MLLEIVLNISTQAIKVNVKGTEEFSHVLNDLGIKAAQQKEILEVFQNHYLNRIEHINNAYENTDNDIDG